MDSLGHELPESLPGEIQTAQKTPGYPAETVEEKAIKGVRKMCIAGLETTTMEIEWHNMCDNPNDIPNNGIWFICKIKGSDNLKLVCGYENVNADHWDAWAKVNCPY